MFKQGSGVLWRQWAPLPLRLMIGYGFLAHGWAKLSRGPAGFAKLLDQIGAPLPELTAWVSTLIEIVGGLAILAGAFVAVVSVPLIVMMLVAMFTVHLRYGFSAINTIGLTADGGRGTGRDGACPGLTRGACRRSLCAWEHVFDDIPGISSDAVRAGRSDRQSEHRHRCRT